MDGMNVSDSGLGTKPGAALGMSLQVQVSDTATVVFQTHMERDNPEDRNRSIDVAHAAAERLFYRYRITGLRSKIAGNLLSIERERTQQQRDAEAYKRDTAARQARRGDLEGEARAAFQEGNRRGEWKPDTITARKLDLIDTDQEKAREAHENNQRTAAGNIEQLTAANTVFQQEIEQIEKLLDAAHS